ncbi:hypothetical protein C485_03073 [Natrinema altunense JCM 12890]|uniref:Uncharacterized protein n=1 Tax=Natrinema altunense (strain JCM 12890 / CGMCC 1.3731 / AJ2) TaxID=1227494 RepID=L9ZVV2_NATA2|nr:hypothetical protein C485_03073 [Natrinema altunense JCM 12890]
MSKYPVVLDVSVGFVKTRDEIVKSIRRNAKFRREPLIVPEWSRSMEEPFPDPVGEFDFTAPCCSGFLFQPLTKFAWDDAFELLFRLCRWVHCATEGLKPLATDRF